MYVKTRESPLVKTRQSRIKQDLGTLSRRLTRTPWRTAFLVMSAFSPLLGCATTGNQTKEEEPTDPYLAYLSGTKTVTCTAHNNGSLTIALTRENGLDVLPATIKLPRGTEISKVVQTDCKEGWRIIIVTKTQIVVTEGLRNAIVDGEVKVLRTIPLGKKEAENVDSAEISGKYVYIPEYRYGGQRFDVTDGSSEYLVPPK